MRLGEINGVSRYDTIRLSKAIKGLAQKSNDFYNTNARLEILLRLMQDEPTNGMIMRIIEDLPHAARSYIMKNIVSIMPDGSSNEMFNPASLDKKPKHSGMVRLPKIVP